MKALEILGYVGFGGNLRGKVTKEGSVDQGHVRGM